MSGTLNITLLKKKQASAARSLLSAVFNDYAAAEAGADVAEALSNIRSSPMLAASVDGQVVGVVQCLRRSFASRRWYDIRLLAVAPAAQGQGIGHALMQHAEAHISQAWSPNRDAVVALVDETKAHNPGSTFYEKMGYHPEEEPRSIGGFPVLEKKLPAVQLKSF